MLAGISQTAGQLPHKDDPHHNQQTDQNEVGQQIQPPRIVRSLLPVVLHGCLGMLLVVSCYIVFDRIHEQTNAGDLCFDLGLAHVLLVQLEIKFTRTEI